MKIKSFKIYKKPLISIIDCAFLISAVVFFIACPSGTALAQQLNQYFEHKLNNFVFSNPVFIADKSETAFIAAGAGGLNAFTPGSDRAGWHYKIKNGGKIKKIFTSFDRLKILLHYEDNSFDIIKPDDGSLICSDPATPSQSPLFTSAPAGFIIAKNNEIYEAGGDKIEKFDISVAARIISLDSVITRGGKFYFCVLTAGGFELYKTDSFAKAEKISEAGLNASPASKILLYYNLPLPDGAETSGPDETLKTAISNETGVKIYGCGQPEALYINELKTAGPVSGIYGSNGLPGGGAVIIARSENNFTGFNDLNFSEIFKLETKARSSFPAAFIHAEGSAPLFLYYSSNESINLFNTITKKETAGYKFEQKPSPAAMSGLYSKNISSALFLVPLTNSILCLQISGIDAAKNFYFSSEDGFASPYRKTAGASGLSAPEIFKNIDARKIIDLYNLYKNETHIALGILFLLAALAVIRKRLRSRGKNGHIKGGLSGEAQITRIQEMLAATPENVELILNLIQLYKNEEKYEQAAEYYKTLIKLRPYDEQYYEQLIDLRRGYFQFVNELIAIYKKKAMVKASIKAYESRRAALAANDDFARDENYLYILKILARLYIEEKPYAGESQSQSAADSSKKAAAILEEIISIEANAIDELILLADQYTKIEDYEKAAGVLKKLIEIDRSGNLTNHYYNLFVIYNRLSLSEEAVEIFRMVIEVKNSSLETLLPLAAQYFNDSFKTGNKKNILLYGDCIISAYNKQKNVNAALAAIDKILAVYPQQKAIIKRKAFLMLENDIENGIVDIFKQLCELFPDDTRVRYEYCRLLYKHQKYDESMAIIFDSLKKKENEDKYIELFSLIASVLIKEKKYQRVIDLAPTAYKLSQSNKCLKCLAEAYLKSGDIDRAHELYVKVAQLNAGDADAQKRQKYIKTLIDERGIIEMKSSTEEDIELLIDGEPVAVKRSAIDAESRVQVSPVEIQAAEAKLYYEKNDYKKAIPMFQQLIKIAPAGKRSLLMSIFLMDCFLKESMGASAEKIYNSIELKNFNLSAGEELAFKFKSGGVFLDNGNLEKAEAIFSEIAAIDMSYKNTAEIISSIKEKIAARRAEEARRSAAASSAASDDSDRTMIASVANETDYIDKRYKVVGQIGKGGMGIVYRAQDTQTNSEVAIKIPILTFKDDRGFMERFEREADVSSRLKHPNILNIFDVIKSELPYMTMELLTGRSLKEILKEKKSFSPVEMRDIAVQCCDALAYTHGLNIIHRDIKPENIMIVENNKVKIMDFGLAKALDESSVTKAGTILGTFAYISPEQCLGEHIDGRADLYSLGIMLYEMLTGEKPFTSGDYVHQHLKVKPQAPTKKNPLIPYPVEAIVLKCIEKKPQDRYATADELKDALLKIV